MSADNRMTSDKLDTFINAYLKEDLKDLKSHLDIRNSEIMELVQLKNMIETMKEHFSDGFKTQMNIGGNIFMRTKVPQTDRILVNVGKGIYVDFTLDEALVFIDFKVRVLNKEVDVISDESTKKQVDVKLALMCLGAKNKLHEEGDC